MSSPVVVIPPETSARRALTLLRRRGIHSLIVDLSRENQTSYGIVTTSDIRDKIAGDDDDAATRPVSGLTTAPIVWAGPEWTVREGACKTNELGIHHLPVEDEGGTLVGVVSATEISPAVEEAGGPAGEGADHRGAGRRQSTPRASAFGVGGCGCPSKPLHRCGVSREEMNRIG
jgi:CBS domain-containing membrane protein